GCSAVTKAFVAPAGSVFLKAFAVVGKSVELVVPVTNAIPALLSPSPAIVSMPLPPRRVEYSNEPPPGLSLVTNPSVHGAGSLLRSVQLAPVTVRRNAP